jgi:hypothetical protein
MSFFSRIGGVLVAPRRTFAQLADGQVRGADVAWLLAAKLLVEDLPALVRACFVAGEEGVARGAQLVLVTARNDLLSDILGILIAGVIMSFFVAKESRGYGRTLELAAYAWIPYLACELVSALFFTARGYLPEPHTQQLVDGAALAWATVAWTFALLAARVPKEEVAT